MSWLADRKITYQYKLPNGSIVHFKLPAADVAPPTIETEEGIAEYAGFEPDEVKQVNIVEYDKNGRKAVRIRGRNGEIQHISKTKLKYMKTGRIENQYTPEFQQRLEKSKQEQLLRDGSGKGKGTATQAKMEKLLKDMPDGEYVSDGSTVVSATAKKG